MLFDHYFLVPRVGHPIIFKQNLIPYPKKDDKLKPVNSSNKNSWKTNKQKKIMENISNSIYSKKEKKKKKQE